MNTSAQQSAAAFGALVASEGNGAPVSPVVILLIFACCVGLAAAIFGVWTLIETRRGNLAQHSR